MSRLLALVGMTIGGWIGWAIGVRFSLGAALFLGVLGTALGLYAVRRLEAEYL